MDPGVQNTFADYLSRDGAKINADIPINKVTPCIEETNNNKNQIQQIISKQKRY